MVTLGIINQIIALKCGFILRDMLNEHIVRDEEIVNTVYDIDIKNGERNCMQIYKCDSLNYLYEI